MMDRNDNLLGTIYARTALPRQRNHGFPLVHDSEGEAGQWEFFTTGMVMLEVLRGARDARQLVKIEASFSLMNFIPATHTIWTRAHRLAWDLDRSGIIIPAQDHLIAACALEMDPAILTADAHFQHYPGLTVLRRLMD